MKNRQAKYDNKHIRKTIRFTKDEFAKIEAQLATTELTFTEFARSAILKKKIALPIEKKMLSLMSEINTNLQLISESENLQNDKINVLQMLVKIEKDLSNVC